MLSFISLFILRNIPLKRVNPKLVHFYVFKPLIKKCIPGPGNKKRIWLLFVKYPVKLMIQMHIACPGQEFAWLVRLTRPLWHY